MAVHYNKQKNKIVIEIDLDNAYDVQHELVSRKKALLQLIEIAEEDRITKDMIYWALQMVRDLEPTEKQYAMIMNAETNKKLKS